MDDRDRLLEEEDRKIRQLRLLVDLTVHLLYQDASMDLSEARDMIRRVRRVTIRLFPGKGGTFDLILQPRFERILRERWGEGLDSMIH